MFRRKGNHAVGVLVVIVIGWWLVEPPPALAQATKENAPKAGDDSLGYTAHFQRELRQIGQISPEEFARRYPGQAKYLDKICWDPYPLIGDGSAIGSSWVIRFADSSTDDFGSRELKSRTNTTASTSTNTRSAPPKAAKRRGRFDFHVGGLGVTGVGGVWSSNGTAGFRGAGIARAAVGTLDLALTHDLLRAACGVAIMLLGVGATLLGWLLLLGLLLRIDPAVPFRLDIILIPVLLGGGLFVAGVGITGKSRAGITAAVGMGTAVLLSGIAMYVLGFTDDDRDPVLFLFWGTWLVWLGLASLAVGIKRASSAKSITGMWKE